MTYHLIQRYEIIRFKEKKIGNKLYKDWFVIKHNVEKIVGYWRLTECVILSIMHNTNNENLYTFRTFYIFLNIQFK
jgi:hypothetical protein